MSDKPNSTIKREIFELTQELHIKGHTRKEIVYYLREVADYTENYWEGSDTYNKSPSEKGPVALPGDPPKEDTGEPDG